MGTRTFDDEHIVQIMKRKKTAAERKQIIGRYFDTERFCGLLDHLPLHSNFRIGPFLKNIQGVWAKQYPIEKDDDPEALKNPAWLNLKSHIWMTSSEFFPYKNEVLDAIAKKHGQTLVIQNLGREEVESLKHELNKSREGIEDEFKSRLAKTIKIKSVEKKLREAIKNLYNRSPKGLARVLTKQKLKSLYNNKRRTLQEIADEFHCSKQGIMWTMRKYELDRRGQSEARIEAIKRGKFERFIYDDIDENFFSQWSPQMSWVLGLLFTDGNVGPSGITLSSVDIDLLEKVRMLLGSKRPIAKREQSYDKTKHIYLLGFYREKMREDCKGLGLHEKKSLTLQFPDVPDEYMRHFIRGCWDGDGSIYIDGRSGKLRASYVSGSEGFIETLVQELYKVGIHKVKPPSDKTEADEVRLKYPDGRFPLKIHKDNRAKAYYIRVDASENLGKLFHYFYDDVDESNYLKRKYEVFAKGLKIGGGPEDG